MKAVELSKDKCLTLYGGQAVTAVIMEIIDNIVTEAENDLIGESPTAGPQLIAIRHQTAYAYRDMLQKLAYSLDTAIARAKEEALPEHPKRKTLEDLAYEMANLSLED